MFAMEYDVDICDMISYILICKNCYYFEVVLLHCIILYFGRGVIDIDIGEKRETEKTQYQ